MTRSGDGIRAVERWDEVFKAVSAEPRRQIVVSVMDYPRMSRRRYRRRQRTRTVRLTRSVFEASCAIRIFRCCRIWGSSSGSPTRSSYFVGRASGGCGHLRGDVRLGYQAPDSLVVGCRRLERTERVAVLEGYDVVDCRSGGVATTQDGESNRSRCFRTDDRYRYRESTHRPIMNVTILPSSVEGTVRAPPSKSYTHRAILAAGYADRATISDALWSADTGDRPRRGTVRRRREPRRSGHARDRGFDGTPAVPADVIDCENSGTTMRLVTATAALADGTSVLTGDESLRSVPRAASRGDRRPRWRGREHPWKRPGTAGRHRPHLRNVGVDPRRRLLTVRDGLLMAGAVTDDGIEISLETELKSAPYVEITIELLSAFGVDVRRTDDGFAVDGGQRYDPRAASTPFPATSRRSPTRSPRGDRG